MARCWRGGWTWAPRWMPPAEMCFVSVANECCIKNCCGFNRKKVWWVHVPPLQSRRHVHITSRALQACGLIGDISIAVESPACVKCWASETSWEPWMSVDSDVLNWICAGLAHRIAGPPPLPLMSLVLLRVMLASCSCTKPHIPQQGRVCTSPGNRSVQLSNLASQYPLELSWSTSSRRVCALATVRDPAWRSTAAVLAATTKQDGQFLSASMPEHSLQWSSPSTHGASEYL